MITNVGKRIRIDAGNHIWILRDCDSPGKVEVARDSGHIELPGNEKEAEQFIRAYRRALAEDIGYRESRCE